MKDSKLIGSFADKHPSLFRPMVSHRVQSHEDPRTIIIAQPRSGSTLLMRLLYHACMTNCVGDRVPGFYKSLVDLYDNWNSGNVINRVFYGVDHENFCDYYSGFRNKEDQRKSLQRTINESLFCRMFRGHCKITCLGWNDEGLLPRFVNAMRELYDDDLTIIWLTRNPEDIAESLYTRKGSRCYQNDDARDTACKLAETQAKLFNQNRDFDEVFDYENLVDDPMSILKACKPVYKPTQSLVEKIMANKIR